MIGLLALRNLAYRPWRSALLFLGYGIGVSVMIVLLSIGEALLSQARDEKLVGGGDITVLPEGIDVEVMKTGGIGGLFFSIDHARFIQRQILGSPRMIGLIRAAAPQIDGRLVYLRTSGGAEFAARAGAEVPSANVAVGAARSIATGDWRDDDGDRRWMSPSFAELRHEVDRFHRIPAGTANPESWAEWQYFNVLSADGRRWAFISLIVAGDTRGEKWGGNVGITLRGQGGATRRYSATVPRGETRTSLDSADMRIGSSTVRVLPDGRYALTASATAPDGERVRVRLTFAPARGAYFPPASFGEGAFVSGYVVPALRASADGEICIANRCERFENAQGYHDHNWGSWQGVSWDWGAARAGAYTLLYGRVASGDPDVTAPPLVVYVVDSLGFRAVFRPRKIDYTEGRTIDVDGERVRVPATAKFEDIRGSDTLRVSLAVEDAIGTDMQRNSLDGSGLDERGDKTRLRLPGTRYFIQMKGLARIEGRLAGAPLAGSGYGFFETYR